MCVGLVQSVLAPRGVVVDPREGIRTFNRPLKALHISALIT